MSRNLAAVLLVGPSITGGGAEGRFRTLATRLFGGSADVAVLVSSEEASRELGARLLDLRWAGAFSYPRIALTLIRRLRERRYSAVMALGLFPGLVIALALLFAPRAPLYVYSEITRPLEALKALRGWRRRAYKWLWKFTVRRFDVLTANSIDGLDEVRHLTGRTRQPAYRLYNLVDSPRVEAMAKAPLETEVPPTFLFWHGRLEKIKRVDSIIRAFADCCRDFEAAYLVILGEGQSKDELQLLSHALGVADRVIFLPGTANPFPVLTRARGFILASQLEGFSNAVIEAMFLDVPVITSYCSSDARAMCKAGAALGFEVGDDAELSRQMRVVLECEDVRRGLIEGARAYRAPHELSASLAHYESIFRECAG